MNQFVFSSATKDIVMAKVLRFIDQWPDRLPCEIVIKQFRKTRSSLQNRALWGVAYKLLSEHTGYRVDELHQYMCGEYFGWEQHEIFGKTKLRPRRTTTTDEDGKRDVISTTDCMEFYAFLQQFASENLGLYIPDPDPDWKVREEAA